MKREIPSVLVLASLAIPGIASAPAPTAAQGPAARVTICHNTSSQRNPVVVITVSENALQAHLEQHGDELFIDGACGGGGGGGGGS